MKKYLALFFVILVLTALLQNGTAEAALDYNRYPGVRASELKSFPLAKLQPATRHAFYDLNDASEDGCHAGSTQSTVRVCKYGYQTGYAYTVAIIGDSHSAQWLGAVQQFATKYKIRIVLATKSACGLSSTYNPDYPSCNTWNKKIIPVIAAYKPDLVLTKADNSNSEPKVIPTGFIAKFKELERRGIDVLAIRDTPYFDVNVPNCVRTYGRHDVRCKVLRSKTLPTPSAWDKLLVKPKNVHYVDYSSKICDAKYCNPTQGNVLVMRDHHHMTDSYSRTFKKYLSQDMIPLLREARAKRYAE